ncbi:hypothetical protein VP01_4731g1 [Puccinia sorghi]|uniref:Tet-like 2OG-Fe(II) oxygenase domain-containing protein n=1 Tax=Puccinia sorghi TaxID=27349 RepID=A0A0L6UMY1_9BASI|nr:hypothetical protein VP01_4731g1 [Puccinia sorghi]
MRRKVLSHSFAGLINLGRKPLLFSSSIRFQPWILNHNINVSANISLLKQPIRIPPVKWPCKDGRERISLLGLHALYILGICIVWDGERDMKKHRNWHNGYSSKAMFLKKTPSLENGSTQFLVLYLMNSRSNTMPLNFTCHLSFTISNLSKKERLDNDASPFIFLLWIPIEQNTVNLLKENFEVKGGQFLFPDDSCTTAYSHLTLPSTTPFKSLNTQMGISCQLPKKTQEALEKIKQNVYAKDRDKSHWGIRDMNKIISDSASCQKRKII